MVLAAVLLSLAGLKIIATPANLFAAGSASGFMGTLTSIGAAPMAIVYQHSTGPVMRSTLNTFFVVGGVISLAALTLTGHMGWKEYMLAAFLTPFALIGFLFSHWGRRLVDKGRVNAVVLTISAASALILIVKQLF
jgi:uncharacterized membrane protein YfcA